MNNIVEKIKNYPDFIGATGRTADEICQAEAALGLSFAEDYRCYLCEIGLACFDGRELTGITSISRVDVVTVTQEQKQKYPDIPVNWYVVEEANIDGIVIWQSETGEVFQSTPDGNITKISNSLIEYIEK